MTFRNLRRVLLAMILGLSVSGVLQADNAEVLFQDDFSQLDPGWGEADSVVHVENGKFVVVPPPGGGRATLNQAYVFEDMTAEVTVNALPPANGVSSTGLVFWGKANDDYFLFWVNADGKLGVNRYMKNRWLTPVPARFSEAVKKGSNQPNRLRVVTRGSSATIFVNGVEIVSFRAQAPAGGSLIGLYGETPTVTEFSNLKITR